MTTTRIKICGITRAEDARVAVELGVDALGLVFHEASPRCVNAAGAGAITEVVPPFVSIVALFVDPQPSLVQRALDAVPIDLIQFHGDESAEFCRQFGRPWIKALRVRAGLDLAVECARYAGARGVLLDTWKEGVPGGTGTAFDWRLAAGKLPLPVVLAGGLHAGNVGTAIHTLRPAAVDVSGGVESEPGIKDGHRIQQFIAAVRAADRQVYGGFHDN